MQAFRQGDQDAARQLVEMFYPQLRRIAATRMKGERADHSWRPTELVNELYLEMIKIKALKGGESSDSVDERTAFFGLAGHLMRRLLIHHARPLRFKAVKVEVDERMQSDEGMESVTRIEVALSRLEVIRPRLRAVVEMRVFEGLTGDEIAERLHCARATVTREWEFARHWLQKEFGAAV